MEILAILAILLCPLMHLLMMRKGGQGHDHCLRLPGRTDQEKVRDPVCGMEKKKSEFAFTSEDKGKTYYFCSKKCQEMFEGHPRGDVGE